MAYPGSQTKITIIHDREATADLVHKFVTSNPSKQSQAVALIDLISDVSAAGTRQGSIGTVIDDGNAASASGTIVFSGVGQAADTVLINGVTFTAQASGATGNQWNVGGTATLSAANLAAAIVASATALVNLQVTASALTGTVTISSIIPGVSGNAVTIAKGVDALSAMTVSGARLTGGLNATNSSSVLYKFGV